MNSHTFACLKKKFTHKFKQLFSKGKYRFATMFPSRLGLGLLITNSKKQKSEATSKNEVGGDEKHFFFLLGLITSLTLDCKETIKL